LLRSLPVPPPRVRHCVLCGATAIMTVSRGRIVDVRCHTCTAHIRLEYDPPDVPHVRASIEVLHDPRDDKPRGPVATATRFS